MRSARRHLPGFWLLAIGLRAVLVPALCFGQTPPNRIYVQSVLVPDVQGMPFGEASNILERLGLRAEQLGRIESNARAGTVVRQDPQPKIRVARGSAVQLTVSTGRIAPALRMPDLFGMMLGQASAVLARLKVRVEPSGTVPSPHPTGTIVAQIPAANAELPPDRIAKVTLAAALPARRVVPKVVGMPLVNAVQILARAGLTTGQVARRYDPSPAGIVLDQYPSPGQDADPRAPVNVTISEGPSNTTTMQAYIVPNIHGQSVDTGRAALERAGLTLGQVEQAMDPSPRGLIFDQSPPPGAQVAAGAAVNVHVSVGGVYVPDVTGRTEDPATRMVSDSGLRVGVISKTESAEPVGNVIGQNPQGGVLVNPGTAIALVVSSGPPPQPTSVVVPKVVGMPEQEARATIESAGLRAGPVKQLASSQTEGTVIDQDPIAGSQVTSGRAVQLFVSSSSAQSERTVAVPDLSGMTLGKARDILAGVQLDYAVVSPTGSADEQALVQSQSPLQGERVQLHTVVQLGLEPPSTPWTRSLWTLGGIGFLGLMCAVAYGFGKKRGGLQSSMKLGDVARLSLVLRRNWSAPRIAMKIGNAADLALRFTARRDPGRQTIRVSAANSPRE